MHCDLFHPRVCVCVYINKCVLHHMCIGELFCNLLESFLSLPVHSRNCQQLHVWAPTDNYYVWLCCFLLFFFPVTISLEQRHQ